MIKRLLFLSVFLSAPFWVYAADNRVVIRDEAPYRYIESNGIPNHSTGRFPNKDNPNSIAEQNYQFKVPLHPQFATKVTMLELGVFGVALNGVPFEPGADEFYKNDPSIGLQYEALSKHVHLGIDKHNAHVQPSGAYHYHGMPTGFMETLPEDQNVLVGYAADGFPIYVNNGWPELFPSYFLGAGQRAVGPEGGYDGRFIQDYVYVLGRGDLDECNGRIMISPEYPQGIYTYFITKTFPFIPRCFKGVPDPSFKKRKKPPKQARQGPPGPQDIRSGRRPPPHHQH